MAKEKFSRTKACATKTLYGVMKEMSRRGGSMPAKEPQGQYLLHINDH